ncbi:class I SAM-dependent rRNA methyltransferase [Paenibacillus taiwanensis]|uniref:class I SAM-dependent rRNA methyltransferase n=1 Tax=Paenibacillus taiwanensis TaxID=401638 RepID=UPI000561CADE|nr:class I SAM-dependent rRNA methyltransferase [Paenibacillus taiwanensis]
MHPRPQVVLTRSRKKRTERSHPWVYQSEIERIVGQPEPGALVDVVTDKGKYLATGYYNAASQITVRIVSYEPAVQMDTAYFAARFRDALKHRQRFLSGATAYRFVYGEADFLPGLVVDRFDDILVVQIVTLGMDVRREAIIEALVQVLEPAGIYERSDVPIREREGLEQRTGLLFGECPRHVQVQENGLTIEVDIVEGQKTGYFFDQRENRASIEPLMTGWGERSGIRMQEVDTEQGNQTLPVNAKGKPVTFPWWDGATVLECFAHTGSFTLHACKYGAKSVTCLDISDHAIQSAKRNVELNGFTERVEFVVADAFEYLRMQVRGQEERLERASAASPTGKKKMDTSKPITASGGRTWDVVILDPPAFAKTKGAVEGAYRGYKDINLQGLKLVNEGGYLVTASCSYHMRPDLFMNAVLDAAQDAGKVLRLIEWRTAGKDHPQIAGVDEGHYLKFAVFEVRSK